MIPRGAVDPGGRALLPALVSEARDRWADWHGRPAPRRIDPLVVAGGPAHRRRLLVVLFDGAQPRVVAKVALDAREDGFVRQEAEALAAARAGLPAAVTAWGPEPLGWTECNGRTVAFARGVSGRRVADPRVHRARPRAWRMYDRFLDQALGWSAEMAASSSAVESRTAAPRHVTAGDLREAVTAFARDSTDSAREREVLSAFADAVGRTGVAVITAWQHGDLALSNSLWDGQRFRFLDWEHADPSWEPWTDTASAPVGVLSMGRRQTNGGIAALMQRLFAEQHPAGAILRRRMTERWMFPLPLAWGVALTCVRRARLRGEAGRAVEPWASVGRLLVTDDRTRRAVPWLAPRW